MDAIKDAARRTFDYRGRSERLEHWAFGFFTAFCVGMILAVHRFLGSINQFPLNWIVLVVGGWLLLANIALMVRRLHDHNFSGFLLFLPLGALTVWLFGYDQFTNFDDPILSSEHSKTMVLFGKWSFASSCIAIMSFFARPGDKNEKKYGYPA